MVLYPGGAEELTAGGGDLQAGQSLGHRPQAGPLGVHRGQHGPQLLGLSRGAISGRIVAGDGAGAPAAQLDAAGLRCSQSGPGQLPMVQQIQAMHGAVAGAAQAHQIPQNVAATSGQGDNVVGVLSRGAAVAAAPAVALQGFPLELGGSRFHYLSPRPAAGPGPRRPSLGPRPDRGSAPARPRIDGR